MTPVFRRMHVRPYSEVLHRGRKGQLQVCDGRIISGSVLDKEMERNSDLGEFSESSEIEDSVFTKLRLHVVFIMEVQAQLSQVLQFGQSGR